MAAIVNVDAVVPCRADRARARLDTVLGSRGDQRPLLGRTSVSEMHWMSGRRLHSLLPTADVSLAVTPIDDVTCLLTVRGRYRPPFGRLGSLADQAVMHRFADATATEFADRLARALAHDSEEGLP
jgi:hypothetical protein